MRNIDWIFTYNHIDDEPMRIPDEKLFPIKFELFDGDGEQYFTGYMTKELYGGYNLFDPLDYAEQWGCTEMKINGETI